MSDVFCDVPYVPTIQHFDSNGRNNTKIKVMEEAEDFGLQREVWMQHREWNDKTIT